MTPQVEYWPTPISALPRSHVLTYPSAHDAFPEVTPRAALADHAQLIRGLDNAVHSNEVRVGQRLQSARLFAQAFDRPVIQAFKVEPLDRKLSLVRFPDTNREQLAHLAAPRVLRLEVEEILV